MRGFGWRARASGWRWACWSLPGIFRRRKAGWQQALAALAFGIFLFSLTANFGVVSRTQIGFILKKNAPLLLTPTRAAEVSFDFDRGRAGAPAADAGKLSSHPHGVRVGLDRRDQLGSYARNSRTTD